MRFRLTLTLVAAASLVALAGCGSSTSDQVNNGNLLDLAESVDVGRMMETVEYLSSQELKGRPTGSEESLLLEDWLADEWDSIGLEPLEQLGLSGYRQEFEVPSDRCFLEEPPAEEQAVTGANVVGCIPGSSQTEMVILTANYDGLGRDTETGLIYPGADYNASGTSAVIELARVLLSREERPEKTLVFALLGAEECGGYGSRALAESLEEGGFRHSVRIINLEGLGGGEGDYMDVWDLNYRKNRPSVEALEESADMLDVELELGGADPGTSASTFFLYHLPAVTCDWSWFDRDDHADFHLPSDTPERLNPEGLAKVTRVVAVASWKLAS